MKKYERLDTIGNWILNIAAVMILLTLCIDLDASDDAWKYMLGFMILDVVIVLVGLGMIYIVSIEAVILSAIVVLFAFLYKLVSNLSKFLFTFHMIKEVSGQTYGKMFIHCVHQYDRYVENKLREESDA